MPPLRSVHKKALEAIDGVTVTEIHHETGIAVVLLSKQVPNDVLAKAVTEEGHTVIGIR